jgi:uncharacterized membrane protein
MTTPTTPQPSGPTHISQSSQKPRVSAWAVVSLSIGIVSLLLCWVPILNNLVIVLAIIGVIFSIIGIVGTKAGRRSGRGMAIAGLVLGIIAVVGVLGTQAMYGAALDNASKSLDSAAASASDSLDRMSGDATDDLLGKEITVDLGQFSATKDQYGLTETTLPVHVVNLASEPHTYSVQIEAVDASGNRVTDDTLMVNNLGAGQAQDLTAFEYQTDDKIEALKTATFKVTSISQM